MSGSYDRPTGPPTLRPLHSHAEHEAFEEHTGSFTTGGRRTGPAKLHAGEGPRTRSRRGDRNQTAAPIVPAGSVTGRSLTLVITIMCFLACLTAGAVYMMNQSASAWLRDIASEVTVQIESKDKNDVDRLVADVSGYLSRQPGIAIELDRQSPPDLGMMRAELGKQFKGVSLDDHRRWQQQIRTITRSFALGGLAILLLVGAATTSIIVSATKSAMASNREIVEVLHFVGATVRFIAREFERHFLRLGVRAGIVGAVWAMFVFLVMPTVMELLGGGSVTITELRRLIGIATLDPPGYFLLGIVVLVIASLCMLTSRIGVYRILNSQH